MKTGNLFTAICLIFMTGVISCKPSSSDKKEIEQVLNKLYNLEYGIYEAEFDTGIFSHELIRAIEEANEITRLDRERIQRSEFPTDKPILVEGAVFSSLLDGFTGYHIKEIKINDSTAVALIDMEYDANPKETWTDEIVFVYENGWKIDNVIFSEDYSFYKDVRAKLSNKH
jgi:hypothetical protein